jgi:hypothetical protein
LIEAGAAARAPVVVEPVAVSGAELDDRVFRTRAEAPIALAAVPARQAPSRLEGRVVCGKTADYLCEIFNALDRLELRLLPL